MKAAYPTPLASCGECRVKGISLWTLALLLLLVMPLVAHAASEPLAEVDGEAVRAEELEKALGGPLARLQ
jgi:hypothetical protein